MTIFFVIIVLWACGTVPRKELNVLDERQVAQAIPQKINNKKWACGTVPRKELNVLDERQVAQAIPQKNKQQEMGLWRSGSAGDS